MSVFNAMTTHDIEKMTVTTTEIAKVLGVSQPRITQLENEGILRRDKDRRFNLCQSVFQYIDSRRRKKVEGSDADYEKARARKMAAQAEKEEMELAKRKGELVEISDVVDIVRNEYAVTRQKIFAIPNKLAMDVLACETAQEVQAMLEESINDALSELQYDKDVVDEPSQ